MEDSPCCEVPHPARPVLPGVRQLQHGAGRVGEAAAPTHVLVSRGQQLIMDDAYCSCKLTTAWQYTAKHGETRVSAAATTSWAQHGIEAS